MTKTIKFSYADVPTVREFAACNDFIRGLMGPVGGGKTSGAGPIEFIRRAQAQRPGPDGIRRTRWAAIRNSYPMLRDTTIQTVFQWLPVEHFGKFYSAEHRYVVKAFEGCEFEILFRALDTPDDVRKLLSLELTGAFINEMREIPWSIIDTLQGRVGRYPAKVDGGASWSGIWGDTNPPDADSKFYSFFEESKHPPGFASLFKQPSGLSPEAENLPNLPDGYYQRLATGKSQEWINVYIHGKYGFVMDGRPVFPEYNDAAHCKAVEPVLGPTVYRGWDFGISPACTFHQILPDGRWLWFDEMYSDQIDPNGMGIDRFSTEVLDHCVRSFPKNTRFEDVADPAGEQRSQADEKTCFQIMQAKGIDVSGGEQTWTIRRESVAKPLNTMRSGEPQFVLHPRCKVSRKGFMGAYHYRRKQIAGPEQFADQPNKTHPVSDVMDSGQYVATRLFGDSLTSARTFEDPTWPSVSYGGNDGRSEVTGY